MKIKAVRCLGCKTVLISRAIHDFRTCPKPCGKTSIDGGQNDYIKISFDPKVGYEYVELDLPITEKQLFDDWNQGTDVFGLIVDVNKKQI